MSGFNSLKYSKVWFAISALIVIAGMVCSFTLGVPDKDFTGEDRYVASFGEDFDAAASDLDAIRTAAQDAAGAGASASILYNYNSTSAVGIQLLCPSGAAVDTDAVKTAVNGAGAGIESFEGYKLAAGKTVSSTLVVLACFALAWLVVWIMAVFALGMAASPLALLAAVHDTMLSFAFFMLLQTGSIRTLIACGLAACALSAYLNIIKLSALRGAVDMNKKSPDAAALSVSNGLKERTVTLAAIIALAAIGTAIAGACLGDMSAAPYAALFALCLLAAVYSSECFTPCLWRLRQK